MTTIARINNIQPAAGHIELLLISVSLIKSINWLKKVVNNNVPGSMPISVPAVKSRKRIRDAPASMFITAYGATGTIRTKIIVQIPLWDKRLPTALILSPDKLRIKSFPVKCPMPYEPNAERRQALKVSALPSNEPYNMPALPMSTVTGTPKTAKTAKAMTK